MPTLGAGGFLPRPKFAFSRPYVAGILFSFDAGSSVVFSGDSADFVDPSGTVHGRVSIEPVAHVWTSNAYTLDFMIVESWYAFAPFTTQIPLPFLLEWFPHPVTGTPWMRYSPFSTAGNSEFKWVFPPSPTGYWLNTNWYS